MRGMFHGVWSKRDMGRLFIGGGRECVSLQDSKRVTWPLIFDNGLAWDGMHCISSRRQKAAVVELFNVDLNGNAVFSSVELSAYSKRHVSHPPIATVSAPTYSGIDLGSSQVCNKGSLHSS